MIEFWKLKSKDNQSFSKSWYTLISYWIVYKSLWAMIALFFICIEWCTWWTSNTCFSIPKWIVLWTYTCIIQEYLTSRTFTNFCAWINFSWSWTITFARLRSLIVFSSLRTFSTLLWYWIKELTSCCIAFNTIVADLIVTSVTF